MIYPRKSARSIGAWVNVQSLLKVEIFHFCRSVSKAYIQPQNTKGIVGPHGPTQATDCCAPVRLLCSGCRRAHHLLVGAYALAPAWSRDPVCGSLHGGIDVISSICVGDAEFLWGGNPTSIFLHRNGIALDVGSAVLLDRR